MKNYVFLLLFLLLSCGKHEPETLTLVQVKEIDQQFLLLRDKVLNSYRQSPDLYVGDSLNTICAPFDLVSENISFNPYRRFYDMKLAYREGKVKKNSISDYYYATIEYRINEGAEIAISETTLASFDPGTQTMYVRSDIDVKDPLEILNIYHELIHARQAIAVKQTYLKRYGNFEKYVAFHTSPNPKMFISNEIEAFVTELKVLNILLHGELKVRAMDNTLIPQWIVLTLGAKEIPRNRASAVGLSEFAKLYYMSGENPESLREILTTIYKQDESFVSFRFDTKLCEYVTE